MKLRDEGKVGLRIWLIFKGGGRRRVEGFGYVNLSCLRDFFLILGI